MSVAIGKPNCKPNCKTLHVLTVKKQVRIIAKLHKFFKSIEKCEKMIIQFKKVWRQGGLLCKELGSFQWQIIPNMYYLPKHG